MLRPRLFRDPRNYLKLIFTSKFDSIKWDLTASGSVPIRRPATPDPRLPRLSFCPYQIQIFNLIKNMRVDLKLLKLMDLNTILLLILKVFNLKIVFYVLILKKYLIRPGFGNI